MVHLPDVRVNMAKGRHAEVFGGMFSKSKPFIYETIKIACQLAPCFASLSDPERSGRQHFVSDILFKERQLHFFPVDKRLAGSNQLVLVVRDFDVVCGRTGSEIDFSCCGSKPSSQ